MHDFIQSPLPYEYFYVQKVRLCPFSDKKFLNELGIVPSYSSKVFQILHFEKRKSRHACCFSRHFIGLTTFNLGTAPRPWFWPSFSLIWCPRLWRVDKIAFALPLYWSANCSLHTSLWEPDRVPSPDTWRFFTRYSLIWSSFRVNSGFPMSSSYFSL